MRPKNRKPVAGIVIVLMATVLVFGLGQRPAMADVTQVKGSAYGAFVKVGLFGGAPTQVGPAAVVELPATGGRKDDARPELLAQFGPATVFGGQYKDPGRNPSGELKASTEGKTGTDGFVTTSASVVNIGPGPLIADNMSSTCRANRDGVSGSATIAKGMVETSYNKETQEPATTVPIPDKPAPNTVIEGTIDHVGDRFRMVFNEQVIQGGTLTVRAAHMYLLGNIAVGDMIVGESVCGVTDDGLRSPTTTAPAATSAEPAKSGSSGGGGSAPLIVAAVAVAAGLGLVAVTVVRRRRRQAA